MINLTLSLVLSGISAISGFALIGKEVSSCASLWHQQWVPIGVMDDLDPKVIHATTILGKDFVFYTPSAEAEVSSPSPWIAAEDRCPHRAAPLSEGYVNSSNGNIVCRYHGWAFDGQTGSCALIPQLKDSNTAALVRSNPRACLRMYPTCVSDGILWMYLTLGSNTSSLPPIPTVKNDMMTSSAEDNGIMTSRFRQENCRFNRDEAVPMEQYSITEDISPQGFALTHSRFTATFPYHIPTIRRLLSPYVMEVTYPAGFFLLSVTLMVIPVRPGFSRTFFLAKSKAPKLSRLQSVVKSMKNVVMPTWLQRGLNHVTGAGFGDQDVQDAVLQVKQQLRFQEDEAQGVSWQQGWFMPAVADVGVSTFHRWFDRYSDHGKVPWMDLNLLVNGNIPLMSEQLVLDRYTRHTKDCYSCQRTLRLIDQFVLPSMKLLTALFAFLNAWNIVSLPFHSLTMMKTVVIKPQFLFSFVLKALAFCASWKATEYLKALYKRFFTGSRPFRRGSHSHSVF